MISAVEAMLNDPTLYPGGTIPTAGPPVKLVGMIKTVRTVVIADPARNGVLTAYPDGVERNP